ncbi:MAG: M42 family metallopeptidase [Planctomycetota bacterium]|jgi:endoglucanase
MKKETLEFLREVMELPSPSGFEQPVQRRIRKYMEGFADGVRTDVHGNVIGVLNEKAALRVMLAGHADEIGMMITHIDNEGYIYFAAVGGIDAAVLPGLRVHIHSSAGDVLGVIGRKPIHLMEGKDRDQAPKLKDLWIDIGAKDGKDAKKAVAVGDIATVENSFQMLRSGIALSRGFDDRIGAFVVAETLKELSKKKLKVAVYSVATVQEELGLRGARTSAFSVDPHAGIAVDVGFASDYPGGDKKRVGTVNLGDGPILHRGANINPVLGEHLVSVSRKKRIPYQMQAEPRATGTDANAIQVNRGGAAAALVSVPNRYMHTPVELVSLKDVENTVRLLAEAIVAMPAKMDFTPR